MEIQRKLKDILYDNFSPHTNAHGFVSGKDIVTNAEIHVGKKYILNLDLENFFESISYGRVSNMFLRYFKLNSKVAYTLANICCHPDGFLPQGAPTSPIISNIIAKTMDKELTNMARRMRSVRYSRYADDITFSSNLPLPSQIMEIKNEAPALSTNLIKIITDNGFIINNQKVRFQRNKEHQEVTGITVNQKLNVKRTYIRRIRAILHSVEQNISNLDIPIKKFEDEYPFRNKNYSDEIDLFKVLKGMITHVGHVKGTNDSVFIKLATRFNDLVETISITNVTAIKILVPNQFYQDNVFIIESESDFTYYDKEEDDMISIGYGQGTGFHLKGVGLITNYHVLEYVINAIDSGNKIAAPPYNIRYFKGNDYKVSYFAKIIYYDIKKDIVILEPESFDMENKGLLASVSPLKTGDFVRLLGFPQYSYNDELKVTDGKIDRIVYENSNLRYEISQTIFQGNSGGPVVNFENEVVGIAVKGTSVPSQIIPIKEINTLIVENKDSIVQSIE
ncbi:reverse transcriptase domain-containing protein [Desemzia sp. FAM 23988]|uniref:reverse transcriptase domain-containing protein n=1 Tax=unclassified Desemzia TaxID=2685243 RepID=UPI00388557B0